MLSVNLRRAGAQLSLGAPPLALVAGVRELLLVELPHSAAVLDYCQRVGTPLAPVLELLANHVDYRRSLLHSVNRGKTGALITAGMLRWLPWLVLAACEWMGLRPLAFLWDTVVGKVLLVISLLLSLAASVVTKRIVAKAVRLPPDQAVWFDALGLSLRAGAGIAAATDLLPTIPDSEPARQSLTEGLRTGGTLAVMLQRQAAQNRAETLEGKELDLARLPFRLLLPLGSLLLPQFGLLLVVPLLVNAAQQANLVGSP